MFVEGDWKIREITNKYVKQLDTIMLPNKDMPEVQKLEELNNLLAINLLFDSSIKIETMFPMIRVNNMKDKKAKAKKVLNMEKQRINEMKRRLKHNDKLWRINNFMPNPLTIEELTIGTQHEGILISSIREVLNFYDKEYTPKPRSNTENQFKNSFTIKEIQDIEGYMYDDDFSDNE